MQTTSPKFSSCIHVPSFGRSLTFVSAFLSGLILREVHAVHLEAAAISTPSVFFFFSPTVDRNFCSERRVLHCATTLCNFDVIVAHRIPFCSWLWMVAILFSCSFLIFEQKISARFIEAVFYLFIFLNYF